MRRGVMTTRECKEGFKETGESTITVRLWAILSGLVAIMSVLLGGLYISDRNAQATIDRNSERITRLEVMVPVINDNLSQIRDELKIIRYNQQGTNRK
jgi:hypothetical protein